ncbi:MAG: metallophosphoesterase [Propionibacteriaceae bacterium]|jgi:predicted MPP superfamily phosphohydrolase|nr:metallophosphoesterase [Propionibacteriaceae bacterium]
MGLVLPIFLAAVAAAGAWLYFYLGLIRLPRLPKPAAIVTGALVALALVAAAVAMVASRTLPDPRPWRGLGRVLLIGTAGLFYLGLGLAVVLLVNLVWWLASRLSRPRQPRPATEPAPEPGRRTAAPEASRSRRALGRTGRGRAAATGSRRAIDPTAEPDPPPATASRRADAGPVGSRALTSAPNQAQTTAPDQAPTTAPQSRRALATAPEPTPADSGPRSRAVAPPAPDRLRQVTRWLVLLVTLAAVATTAYGVRAGARPQLNEVRLPLTCLPASFDGYRIALISDVHLGLTVSGQDLAELVERVNRAEPDLVVLAGDLVDGTVEALADEMAVLGQLRSTNGSVMVTGNHEYYWNAPAWASYLASLDIDVLDNSGIQLTRPGGVIDLIGVNDRDGNPPMAENLSEAVERMRTQYHLPIDATDRCRILVAHQPVQVTSEDDLPARIGIDLQLSGHTHGGQMWPLGWLTLTEQPVLDGVHQVAGVTLLTSRGVGSWGPPVRVGADPEVVLVTLRQA